MFTKKIIILKPPSFKNEIIVLTATIIKRSEMVEIKKKRLNLPLRYLFSLFIFINKNRC